VERATDDAGERADQDHIGPRGRRRPRWLTADPAPSARRLLFGAAVGVALVSAVLALVTDRSAPSGAALEDVAAATAAPSPRGFGLPAGASAGVITLPPAPTTAATPEPADDATVTGLAANGIPNVALNAYRVAAARIDASLSSCRLGWSLLAAIGRVESNHGRFGGAVVNPDGTSTPPIIGPALDGVSFALISDTDGGWWDGDTRQDRAVGPMQFIPSTWRSYAVDADGSGVADPFDIDDESLAAANYLCVAGGDLSGDAGQRQAVLAYNHSDSYVAQVLALARRYAAGLPVADLPLVGDTTSPVPGPTGGFRAPAAPGPAIGAADSTPIAAGQDTVLPAAAAAAPASGGTAAGGEAATAGDGGSGGGTTSGQSSSRAGASTAAPTTAPAPQGGTAQQPGVTAQPVPTVVAVPSPSLPTPSVPLLTSIPLPPAPVPPAPVPPLPGLGG
jgi:hypothetical protein